MKTMLSAAVALMVAGCASMPQGTVTGSTATPALWPATASPAAFTSPQTEAFITALMSRMTLEEKVGQLIQPDINFVTPEDLRTYPLGSVLVGGGGGPGGVDKAPAADWLALVRAFQHEATSRPGAAIPILFGIDAVHGHNNLVGAVIFPHNIGLGAANDPDLMRRIGEATAEEVAATGMHWTFAPAVSTPQDDRWGRTYEGYSEDPAIVRRLAGPMVEGLQGRLVEGEPLAPGHIATTLKHFLGDGGTFGGDDQGETRVSERELIDRHAQGYVTGIAAGALTVMPSYSSWNGMKMHGNESLLTGVLRGRMGFEGLVIGDWNGHEQIPGCTKDSCPQAFNAGVDIFMVPQEWKALYANTLAQVRSGEIPMPRLDEAVRRILRVKVKVGVFEPTRPAEGRFDRIGSADHRAVAREAVRKSLVLLKNDGVLPIRAGARVLVAGDAADSIAMASGGWTISWQGDHNTNADFPNGQSIWGGLDEAVRAGGGVAVLSPDGSFDPRPDVAIVVFGEEPYAEFNGDRADLDFTPAEPLETLRRLRAAGVPTVAVFLSGRPLWVDDEIAASDAFVAVWLPGSEGGGVADLLIAGPDGRPRFDFTGRLAFSWPAAADQPPQNAGENADPVGYAPRYRLGYGLGY